MWKCSYLRCHCGFMQISSHKMGTIVSSTLQFWYIFQYLNDVQQKSKPTPYASARINSHIQSKAICQEKITNVPPHFNCLLPRALVLTSVDHVTWSSLQPKLYLDICRRMVHHVIQQWYNVITVTHIGQTQSVCRGIGSGIILVTVSTENPIMKIPYAGHWHCPNPKPESVLNKMFEVPSQVLHGTNLQGLLIHLEDWIMVKYQIR